MPMISSNFAPTGVQVNQSGTNTVMNNTVASAGQLFFNTTYNAWFEYVGNSWWPVSKPEPRYGFMADDEFFGTDRIGFLDWNTNIGTVTTLSVTSNQTPGVYIIRQASASAGANLRSGLASFLLGGADIYMQAFINIPTLATALEDFSCGFGFNDNAAYDANTACTDGVYLTLNRAVNGALLIANASSNGSNNAVSATIASATVVGATFMRWGIKISGSGTAADFYLNGVKIVNTLAANIPTGAGRQTGIQFKLDKTAGSGNSDLMMDYFSIYGFFDTPRIG